MSDEVRCPMCGKPNDAGAEVCQYCQARIKPLVGGKLDDDLPDWLRASTPASEPESKTELSAEDWLASLRGNGEEDIPASAGSTPGWQPQEPGEQPEDDLPDWLRTIREKSEQEGVISPFAQEAPEPEAGWIETVRSKAETEGGFSALNVPPPEEDSSGMTPDWLDSIRRKNELESREETVVEGAGEEPDWLASLRDRSEPAMQEPLPAVSPFPAESTGDTALPDWLSSIQAPGEVFQDDNKPSPFGGKTGVTDWLTDKHLEPPKPGEVNLNIPPAIEPDEVPDWLANIRPEGEEPAQFSPVKPSFAAESTEASEPLAAPTEESIAEEGELPEWLAALQHPEAAESEPAFTSEEQMPGWLAELEIPETQPQALEPQPTVQEGEMPDWLEGVQPVGDEEINAPLMQMAGEEEQEAETTEIDMEGAILPFAGEAMPEWLARVQAEATGALKEEEPDVFNLGKAQTVEEEQPSVQPFLAEQLPEWLEGIKPAETTATGGQAAEPEGLAPGILPGWIQAMRPVEAVAPTAPVSPEEDHRVENAGPLAGLEGVLPAQVPITEIRKPPAYTVRLQLTDAQRVRTAMVEQLLADEIKPQTPAATRYITSNRILRWIVAAVLLVTVFISSYFIGEATGVPTAPSYTVAARDLILSLDRQGTVLLAFEYEPALVGELHIVSRGVVDLILAMGPKLAVISTSPTGPLLADRLLQEVKAANPGYPAAPAPVNLGYLPGGMAGLADFAARPQMATPFTTLGESAWQTAALAQIQSVSDFDRVVLFTDSADTARAWLEQVQPTLAGSPLLVVSSSQAAPLLMPYVEAGQIQGLVAGLGGAAAFEQSAQRPPAAEALWNAYQSAVWAAVVIIILGAILNQVLFTRTRVRVRDEEGV